MIIIIITWAGVGALLMDMFCMKVAMMSTGTGNTIVLLFSAEMLFNVWKDHYDAFNKMHVKLNRKKSLEEDRISDEIQGHKDTNFSDKNPSRSTWR